MSWLVPENELTPEQLRAIRLGPEENRAIVGGPGSGKTQILLYRARFLKDKHRIFPAKFRVLVYTNVLKDYIRSALPLLGLPDECVLTFDHWCRLFYEEHIGRTLPWDATHKTPDFAAIRQAVAALIENRKVKLPLYDFVLVDEGQDLDIGVFNLLSKIAKHVTVCLDSKQKIYDTDSNEQSILSVLGIQRRNISLIDAFRVCPYLVRLASVLIPEQGERDAFVNQARTEQVERQMPFLYLADSYADEKEKLFQMIRERQLKNDSIAILFPINKQVFGYAQGLKEAGIEVEVPQKGKTKGKIPTHDFGSSRPKLMSYHSAKGLTFDSVFMPRLTSRAFEFTRQSQERISKLLFVAITRATKWVFISTDKKDMLDVIRDKMLPMESTGQIFVGRMGQNVRGSQPSKIPEIETENDPLDFL
jgi:superfamily I DNA/RNA helicase